MIASFAADGFDEVAAQLLRQKVVSDLREAGSGSAGVDLDAACPAATEAAPSDRELRAEEYTALVRGRGAVMPGRAYPWPRERRSANGPAAYAPSRARISRATSSVSLSPVSPRTRAHSGSGSLDGLATSRRSGGDISRTVAARS